MLSLSKNAVSFLALLSALMPAAVAGASLLASHFSGNLYSLSLSDSGGLTVDAEVSSGNYWPAWLELDSQSQTLYVADSAFWAPPNGLTTFSVDSAGELTRQGTSTLTQGGEVHSSLYGGDDGRGFLGLAYYGSSKLATYALPLGVGSTPLQTFDYSSLPTGPNVRQDASHPHGFHPDPTGRFVLAPDLGTDLIHILSVNPETGVLTECQAAKASPGDGPRHAAFWTPLNAQNGEAGAVVIVNELSNSVTVWSVSYPAEGGAEGCLSLTTLQTLSTLPDGQTHPAGSKAGEIRIRDDFVYVSNRADQSFGAGRDSIATYRLGHPTCGETVSLSFIEIVDSHSYFPRTFQINSAGDLVAVGGQTSATVAILERNTTDGRLGGLLASVRVGGSGTPQNEDGLSAVIWVEE